MAASGLVSSMPEPGRRIFVVGEHGQVAQMLGRECATRGHAVRLAGRAIADITDPLALSAAVADFQPELVINAAAYTDSDKAEDEMDQAFLLNRDGAANVAVAAANVRAPLIHISTDYVFDGSKPSPYVETDAPNPIGAYGASKLAGEAAIAAVGKNYVIIRTSWVYSPTGSNFVKTMLRLASQRDEVGVVDDQWGAPTSAGDLAKAIVSIGEALLTASDRSKLIGIYHASGAGETTWYRFARAIMKGSADKGGPSCRVRPITTREYPTRVNRPANSCLDCSKLARVYGIRMPAWESSLDICLDQMINTPQRVFR
jgi:dTDP-4-dehydrorhamnose reductase